MNDWLIEDRCPQCGGPVSMRETDRILTCAYCKVRLYVLADAVPRYCLPVKPAALGDIVMAPYWRVKAQHYRAVPWELRAGVIDCTRLACAAPGLPASLGVRAQAVPLHFASPRDEGRFLPVVGPPPLPGRQAAAAAAVAGEGLPLFEAAIAATTSLVYSPVRVARSVFDAVLNKRIPALEGDAWKAKVSAGDDRPRQVRFLATLCPECGWQLEGERNSLVLLCVNCGGAWEAGEESFRRVSYDVAPANGCTARGYLPFWRVLARFGGTKLETWADLVRFANLPQVVQPRCEKEPLLFWIPAFRAYPDQFLRLAQALTVGRPALNSAVGTDVPADRFAPASARACQPVTISGRGLEAAVTVLLASLAPGKATVFPLLRELAADVTAASLVYVPMDFNGREYINPGLRLTVQKKTLR